MISSKIIERIYESYSLVDFVGQYVPLKKVGKNFVGLCPFHHEKTPSFSINPEKQLFYCFGCKEGGNIFSFLQKKENLSFIEAVKLLADSLNIKIEESPENEIFYEINKKACNFYSQCLFKEEGISALNYLKERGLKVETIKAFNLGYAPKGFRALKDYLKDYPEELLLKIGLLHEGNPSYDWTRNRIIFPIFDRFNRIIGFGGRALDGSLPKYINTKQTPIYNKGSVLYGLNRANSAIKEKNEIVLVEGYIDVIMCHQNGFSNVVGICGTSLTEAHIDAIRQAENIVISFDPDSAGIKACERSLSLLINKGFNLFVIPLNNMDPAEFLKEKGRNEFLSLLSKKEEFFSFLINIAKNKEPEMAIKYLIPFIEKIDDIIKRELFIKKVSEALFIDEDVIKLALKNDIRPIEAIRKKKENRNLTERLLISLMLEDPEIARLVVNKINSDLLKDAQYKEIFENIKECLSSKGGYNPGLLPNIFPPSLGSLIASLMMESYNKEEIPSLALSCIKKIQEEAIKEEMESLQREIMEKEKRNEDISGLLSSYQKLALSRREKLWMR